MVERQEDFVLCLGLLSGCFLAGARGRIGFSCSLTIRLSFCCSFGLLCNNYVKRRKFALFWILHISKIKKQMVKKECIKLLIAFRGKNIYTKKFTVEKEKSSKIKHRYTINTEVNVRALSSEE